MNKISASQYPDLYKGLSMVPDQDGQGFIMLNTEKIPVLSMVGPDAKDDLFTSKISKFVDGAVAENVPHITLIGGLLALSDVMKPKAQMVLADWDQPKTLEVESVGTFTGSPGDEPYMTVVAHIKVTPALQEGNDRLRMLPHIDYFPVFMPHMTLAYIKPSAVSEWLEALGSLKGKHLNITGVNYGE